MQSSSEIFAAVQPGISSMKAVADGLEHNGMMVNDPSAWTELGIGRGWGGIMAAKIKELISKYGRVAVVVHLSVSAVSYTSCYFAIKNNVNVDGVLRRAGLLPEPHHPPAADLPDGTIVEKMEKATEKVSEKLDHAAVRVLHEGGAFAMAFLCNKALLPVRIPLTVVITPSIARMWARRPFFRKA